MSKQVKPIIVGLDIGTTKVVAIAGRKNEFGKLEVIGFGRSDSAGVSHGVVMNIEQCVKSIQVAIERCLQSNPNLEIKEVYVGIAGHHIKSIQTRGDIVRNNSDDIITKLDIDMLIKDQYKTNVPAGDQIIDVIPQEYTVDNTLTNAPMGMNGVKVGANFHIITGDRNAIRNIKRCVDNAQLSTKDLVLQPLASAFAVMNDEDLEAGVAIVDIGGGTTDMAVFSDGLLKHTAVIPYAGVNITNDIREGLGVLRTQAEQLKVQFGSALESEANPNQYITIPGLRGLPAKEISVKNLANIIQARTQEIMNYVLFHLRQVDLDKKLHGGIILTGGGSRLKHIVQLTSYITGMDTRIGLPNEHLAGNHAEALMNPMYSTCIGLILRGYHDFETGKMQLAFDNGNYVHVKFDQTNNPIEIDGKPLDNLSNHSNEDNSTTEQERMQQSVQKRSENFNKLLNRLRGKFISLFEDSEDQEIN